MFPGDMALEDRSQNRKRKRSDSGKQEDNARSAQGTQHPHETLKRKAEALWQTRRALPVWAHSRTIRKALREHDVLVISGETGSGKSTQVPQMLLSEPWCKATQTTSPSVVGHNPPTKRSTPVGGRIAITQPRRIAATSLARRVAAEAGTPLGSSSPASKVGYSVRFDHNAGPNTKIKFLTEGMLLQEMLRDPWLCDYSAVVVDEVHERGVNVDLILGFLKTLVWKRGGDGDGRGGVPLKVIIMSATADVQVIRKFFEQRTMDKNEEVSGRDEMTGEDLDDGSEWEGFDSAGEEREEDFKMAQNHDRQQSSDLPPANEDDQIPICLIEGRQYPVKTIYSREPVPDWLNASLETIFQIHYKEALPGDILVFMTGQETVESLETLANEYAQSMDRSVPKMLILPLFAALPQDAQNKVFEPTPTWTRKVVLATNIAETSVTVPGVRYVIDCGKAKIKQFRPSIGLDSLLVKPISRSAAIQRQGRAGREAPGQCYRLYTEKDYHTMQHANTPEILRCDLSQAILSMKARGVHDVTSFPLLDPPPREALIKALFQLFQLGALTETGSINDIGRRMSQLSLSCPLARTLLAAAESDAACTEEVIDIISCLSVENIFLTFKSEEQKEKAEAARRTLCRREGDHLTLLATVQAYACEQSDRKAWADRHFVSHRAMRAVMDVRKQLRSQPFFAAWLKRHGSSCISSSTTTNDTSVQDHNINHHCHHHQHPDNTHRKIQNPDLSTQILKCFLRGFATNTARLLPDGSYRTLMGHQRVAIHPSSVLFGKKCEAIMYNEYVYTNRSYAKGVSMIQANWMEEEEEDADATATTAAE